MSGYTIAPAEPRLLFPQQRPTHPYLALPSQPQILTASTPITEEVHRLTSHLHFGCYALIVQDLFELDERTWLSFFQLRSNSASSFVSRHFPNIYQALPHDMWIMVARIRQCVQWNGTKNAIITWVQHARKQSISSGTPSHGSEHGSSQEIYTASTTLTSPSTPRGIQRLDATDYLTSQPVSLHPRFKRRLSSAYTVGSPTSPQSQTTHSSRKALNGHKFYCPSPGCPYSYPRKGFVLQGHYENHMQKFHHGWPARDPLRSIREIPTTEQLDGSDIVGDSGDSVTGPTAPQPALVQNAALTPLLPTLDYGRERPSTPKPETVGPEIIESGTQPAISASLQPSLETPTSIPSLQLPIDVTQYDFSGNWQQLLGLPQIDGQLNHTFHLNDPFTNGQ